MNLQVVFLDDQAGPHPLGQFVLGDQPFTPLDQGEQQIERACAERDRLAFDQQPPCRRVDLEAVEGVCSRHDEEACSVGREGSSKEKTIIAPSGERTGSRRRLHCFA